MEVVYVCFESNCPRLCDEIDAITDLCVFDDAERAIKWADSRIEKGKKNRFVMDEGDIWRTPDDVFQNLEQHGISTTKMFRDHQDNWDANYDICIIRKEVNK